METLSTTTRQKAETCGVLTDSIFVTGLFAGHHLHPSGLQLYCFLHCRERETREGYCLKYATVAEIKNQNWRKKLEERRQVGTREGNKGGDEQRRGAALKFIPSILS